VHSDFVKKRGFYFFGEKKIIKTGYIYSYLRAGVEKVIQLSRFKFCVSNRKTGDVPPLPAPTVIPATPPTSPSPDGTTPDDVDDDDVAIAIVVVPVVVDRLKFFLNPL